MEKNVFEQIGKDLGIDNAKLNAQETMELIIKLGLETEFFDTLNAIFNKTDKEQKDANDFIEIEKIANSILSKATTDHLLELLKKLINLTKSKIIQFLRKLSSEDIYNIGLYGENLDEKSIDLIINSIINQIKEVKESENVIIYSNGRDSLHPAINSNYLAKLQSLAKIFSFYPLMLVIQSKMSYDRQMEILKNNIPIIIDNNIPIIAKNEK